MAPPEWPDVLHEIRASETRVRADIKDVKTDVKTLDTRVGVIEERSRLKAQRNRDWFQAGSIVRSGTLVLAAGTGAFLGILNYLT